MSNLYCKIIILTIYAITTNGYKIPRQTGPIPIPPHNNAAFEYKGPVFVIQETNGTNDLPFIGFIVNGGIEVVRPNIKGLVIQNATSTANTNEPTSEFQEDPDYFAVYLTPENVAYAQFSRTSQITIPLTVLLAAISNNMPRIMVLRKQNHFEYFSTLSTNPRPIVTVPVQIPPQRRRHQRDIGSEHGRLVLGDKNYNMLYTAGEKVNVHAFCTSIVQELVFINEMLQRANNNDPELDMFDLKVDKNATKVDKGIVVEEYAIGTEYKVNKKTA
ncbi:uncharacterized protein LOC135831748 [Planococcus citri]|uniref:uncharacterized protein LOC135831748 n=1 Tax=Planococcus citri TaxID=170843 RepID=UPI0031F870BB